MRYFTVIVLSVILFSACSNKNTIEVSKEVTENTNASVNTSKESPFALSISTSPCFGKCPVYELTFYNNREVKFNGIRFTEIEGLKYGVISSELLEEIHSLAQKANLKQAKEVYDNPAITDLPTTEIVYYDNGIKTSIKARYEVPEHITDFVNSVYEMTKSVKWSQTAVD